MHSWAAYDGRFRQLERGPNFVGAVKIRNSSHSLVIYPIGLSACRDAEKTTQTVRGAALLIVVDWCLQQDIKILRDVDWGVPWVMDVGSGMLGLAQKLIHAPMLSLIHI